MKRFPKTVSLVVFLLAAFAAQLFVVPGTATAAWDDRSDELPGMDNDLTPYLIAGGAIVAGLLIWKIAKGGGDKQNDAVENVEDDQDGSESPSDTRSGQEESSASLSPTETDISKANFGLYFGVDPSGGSDSHSRKALDLSAVTVKAGLTIGF